MKDSVNAYGSCIDVDSSYGPLDFILASVAARKEYINLNGIPFDT